MREIEFTAEAFLPDGYSRVQHYVSTVAPKRKDHKGYYKVNGYVMRLTKNHIHANSRGYVPEHRLIIEEKLGRFLKPREELVHHINGVRDDNRIENLKLSNPKDHAKGHVGERNKNGQFACVSKEFNEQEYRLFDKDRGIEQIYTLNELISKTFRRGKFEYRGRFTGLKDKNGTKIFERDIVKIKDATSETKYSNNEIFFDWRGAGIIKNNMHIRLDMLSSVEIIGNIHQDKHLIK